MQRVGERSWHAACPPASPDADMTRVQEAKNGQYTTIIYIENLLLMSSRTQKCDGNQPICNQCIRFNRHAECEFGDSPSPSVTRELQKEITRLQAKIAELEQQRDRGLIPLQNPYQRPVRSSPGHDLAYRPRWYETPVPPFRVSQLLLVIHCTFLWKGY